jgi:xylan 1,4-beta-xylosidase
MPWPPSKPLILVRIGVALLVAGLAQSALADTPSPADRIVVAADAKVTPLPHFWERMFGSGRAILSLRDGYRQDLRAVRSATGFGYVRFHHILSDEVGLYGVDSKGKPRYNFSYVDQIYDGLLANGVRPFVEIGFMPQALSSDVKSTMSFWYRPNVAPPLSYDRWDDLVRRFVTHLVDRYGIDEVAQWYFEVWNEPNIDFWSGKPKQSTYFDLYAHTARAVKSVNPALRVGGPSTAQAAWVSDFLKFARATGAPVDFVSSHVYANDTAENVLHEKLPVGRDRMVGRAVRKLHDEIAASPYPSLPLILSEYNASYKNEPEVTDAVYMGPWLADTIRQCAGLADIMSYWTFSDVFEEQGVIRTPFYGGFGLLAEHGIPKPAFHAFALLHRLGEQRLAIESQSALATRRADGALVIALWNYAEPLDPPGPASSARAPSLAAAAQPSRPAAAKTFSISVDGMTGSRRALLSRVDGDHGNVMHAFDGMGRPDFPQASQWKELQAAAGLPPPQEIEFRNGMAEVTLPPWGLALVEIP